MLRNWIHSEAMDSLSPEAEVFFVRLIMIADDYGSYWASPSALRAALFPLKAYSNKSYSDVKVADWLDECITAGRVFKYTAGGKSYIRIDDFGQRKQNMRNTFPQPEAKDLPKSQKVTVTHGESPPELEEEVEIEKEVEREVETASAEPLVLPFDSVEFSASWMEWMQYRIQSKKKLTPLTAKKQLALLGGRPEKLAIAMINQSIQNGWQGIFEIKPDSNGTGFNKNKQHLFGIATSIAERYGSDGPGKKG